MSYDSGVEHSWEHWAEVQKLVEEEDRNEVSAEQLIPAARLSIVRTAR